MDRRLEEIAQDNGLSVAERIRRLHVLGVPRADIARMMDKRYQQVRNTLVGPGAAEAIAASRARMEEGAVSSPTQRVAVGEIPPDWHAQVADELRRIRQLLEILVEKREEGSTDGE